MITGIKKKNKLTEIWFDETGSAVNIRTYNTDLKNRLAVYAVKYSAHCRLTDDDECGCLTFEVDRRRFSVRLTAPYSEDRRSKRIAEIDTLIQKIYEDNASGKLSDERYATLSLSYEEEQKTLKAAVPEMQAYLEAETDKTESLQRFIQKVKQVTELKALTPELIHEFVDKIVVYAPRYLDGKRVQLLDIYYSGVGILHELTPEEMEEAFQHHLAQRNKEKTA